MKEKRCIVCGASAATLFFFIEHRGVPHGQAGHHVVHDYKMVLECSQCDCGQLDVYSHDCWSHEEPWEMYWWYAFYPAGVEGLKYLMQDCPDPMNPSCECGVHQFMRHQMQQIHSCIPHARSEEEAQQYCWLRLDMNKENNSVFINIDKSKNFGEVGKTPIRK